MFPRKILPFAAAGLFITAMGLSGPVHSAGGEYLPEEGGTSSTLDVTFTLYAGGIPFGDVTMSTRIQGERYLASSIIETSGLINQFWQSKIEAASNGTIEAGAVKPSRYDNFTTRRNGRREFVMSFQEDGPSTIFNNPERDFDEEELPPDAVEARHSMDPLSAMVFLMNSHASNEANPCGVVAPVYDGQRRYNVEFTYLKHEDVEMDNGLYTGRVMTCQIKYVQVAGELQNIVENGGEMPRIFGWIAEMRSRTDPARVYLVPIRLWTNTEFGAITAVANHVHLDGRAPDTGI
jgi:hypothetical protein